MRYNLTVTRKGDWFGRVLNLIRLATLVAVALILADMLPKIEQQLAFNATLLSAPRAHICVDVSGGFACAEQLGRLSLQPAPPPETPAALPRGASL